MTRRSWRPVIGVAVLMIVANACASDDDGSTPRADTGSTTSLAVESSAACRRAAGAPTVEAIDVEVDGTERRALVHVPAAWGGDGPLPVVLSFHGATSNAATMQAMDGFDPIADAEQFVVVRPEGVLVDIDDTTTAVTGWDLDASEVDEPAFVAAVLDELGRSVCIDPSHVFATGFSIGGEMAMAAACALRGRIAAFGSVGAARSVPCDAGTPTPMIAFHGTSDLIVPYEGAPERSIPPTDDLMAEQAQRNRCAEDPNTTQLTSTVESIEWDDCDADMVLYRLDDHGHSWPGNPLPFSRELVAATLLDPDGTPNAVADSAGLTAEEMADNLLLTNTEIDATELMWEFFTSQG